LGGRDREDRSSKPGPDKQFERLYLGGEVGEKKFKVILQQPDKIIKKKKTKDFITVPRKTQQNHNTINSYPSVSHKEQQIQ
jgi:hypothetical protein